MSADVVSEAGLLRGIEAIEREQGAEAVAVSIYDYATEAAWSLHGDRWFHAASAIKVPILYGVFAAIHRGDLTLQSRVHVRNRFVSAADGEPFRVDTERDANAVVHEQIGKTMRVEELCFHMITTSSNLATNLLIEVIGVERLQESLRHFEGIDFRRGVEDERAFEQGVSNRVTANGLVALLREIGEERACSPELSRKMLEILHGQEFNSGIPAGLPDDSRVAHKTGEISTVAHDAGIVYLPGREPYVVVILSEWEARKTGKRHETIARISRALYDYLQDSDADAGR